ncbi:hypothetical protein PAI11_43640 [Patulibacter medicamentivorans]|uniref:Uncharacterized protein n=1 Tax=Patulibacter medicamentivorans TaxID=1097667 RepID=H0EBX9_9ACTN|nr:hypothetical protein PAI11_43640 [Patulibacter medicamentivorans]
MVDAHGPRPQTRVCGAGSVRRTAATIGRRGRLYRREPDRARGAGSA